MKDRKASFCTLIMHYCIFSPRIVKCSRLLWCAFPHQKQCRQIAAATLWCPLLLANTKICVRVCLALFVYYHSAHDLIPINILIHYLFACFCLNSRKPVLCLAHFLPLGLNNDYIKGLSLLNYADPAFPQTLQNKRSPSLLYTKLTKIFFIDYPQHQWGALSINYIITGVHLNNTDINNVPKLEI